jgi:hypothetical protein
MYYVAPELDPSAPGGERYKTCLALSRDGLRWERPDLGQVAWRGSTRNNILPRGETWMRRPNVIRDPGDPDPARRYKMTYVDVIGGRTAIVKAYSRDGIAWRLNGDGRPWFRREHAVNLLGWDPRIRSYVLFPRAAGAPLAIARSTSPDFVSWSEPVTVLAPQAADAGRDFVGNAAFLYEGLYLGFLWVFEQGRAKAGDAGAGAPTATPADAGSSWTADAELVVSRDGIAWRRVSPGRWFFPRGAPGSWDSEMILPVAPVVRGDRILIYYSGWNTPYGKEAQGRASAGWFEQGRRMQRAIGLATLRLDGFASLDAGVEPGVLVTRPIRCPGGSLEINARAGGDLRVEVLDAAGAPIPGFTAADCRPFRGDRLRAEVRWQRKRGLDALRGKSVALRFVLRSASLYGFRLAPRSPARPRDGSAEGKN